MARSMRSLISSGVGISYDRLEGVDRPATLIEVMSTTEVTYHAKGVHFSEKGAEKVREFLASQQADIATAGLRVGVRGGGCSGFQYQLAFDDQHDGDVVFEDNGLRILVDAQSLPYVDGSSIDYVDSLQGAGFQVNNPNVVAACGCGSSFRVAEDEQVSAV
jgi:iron-sulfur cluster assembly protein